MRATLFISNQIFVHLYCPLLLGRTLNISIFEEAEKEGGRRQDARGDSLILVIVNYGRDPQ